MAFPDLSSPHVPGIIEWAFDGEVQTPCDSFHSCLWILCILPWLPHWQHLVSEVHSAFLRRALPWVAGLGAETCRGEGMWQAALQGSGSSESRSLLQYTDYLNTGILLLSYDLVSFHWLPLLLLLTDLRTAGKSHLQTATNLCNLSSMGSSLSLLQLPPPVLPLQLVL